MTNEDEEHGDLPFHLAWEAILKKELNNVETFLNVLSVKRTERG